MSKGGLAGIHSMFASRQSHLIGLLLVYLTICIRSHPRTTQSFVTLSALLLTNPICSLFYLALPRPSHPFFRR